MMDGAYSTHGVKNYTYNVFLEHQKGPENLAVGGRELRRYYMM